MIFSGKKRTRPIKSALGVMIRRRRRRSLDGASRRVTAAAGLWSAQRVLPFTCESCRQLLLRLLLTRRILMARGKRRRRRPYGWQPYLTAARLDEITTRLCRMRVALKKDTRLWGPNCRKDQTGLEACGGGEWGGAGKVLTRQWINKAGGGRDVLRRLSRQLSGFHETVEASQSKYGKMNKMAWTVSNRRKIIHSEETFALVKKIQRISKIVEHKK